MKHQIWLEDWERELAVMALRYVHDAVQRRIDISPDPVDIFDARWTYRQLGSVIEKFSPVSKP